MDSFQKQTVTPCHHGVSWPHDPVSGMFSPKTGWQKWSPIPDNVSFPGLAALGRPLMRVGFIP